MSEINQVEILIKPQVPKVIDNQQLLVYVPATLIATVSDDFKIDSGKLILNVDLEKGTGINAVQMRADESKNGHLTFPDDTIYAKKLDPTLSLNSEPIGALGDYSATFGGNGQSKGKRAFTAGTTVLAKANYSAAFGDNSVTLAHGTDGMAQGYQTVIDAPASHSEGAYTIVMNQKYVEGMFDPDVEPGQPGQPVEPGTTPTDTLQMDSRRGEAGHADGFNSYVSGFAAHTDGVSNVADGHISKASGRSNRAWSYLSKVDGYQSVVKPDDTDTDATGEGSWANGYDIQLVGAKYAYAGGDHGRVLKGADYSFSYGLGLAALGKAQAVFGQYNNGDDNSVFIVGNGISDTQRNTAFQVLKNGQVIVNSAPVNEQSVVRLAEYNVLNSKIIGNSTEITNLWNTVRETNSNLINVDNNSYKKTGGAISGNVQVTGSLKVQTVPTNPNDVVRKLELDTKYDKAGGTIGGNVIITGDLTVNGTQYTNNTENLMIKNAMIYSNSDGATLATNGGIGIKKNATDVYGIVYDPTSDSVKLGLGKSDNDGNFTFNKDEGEPVAIRDDSSKFTNEHLVEWDAANKKFVDSGYLVDDFVRAINVAEGQYIAYIASHDAPNDGIPVSLTKLGYSIPRRYAGGQIEVGDPEGDSDAVPKKYAENNFVKAINVTSDADLYLYVATSESPNAKIRLDTNVLPYTVPERDAGGRLAVGDPIAAADAIHKKYAEDNFIPLKQISSGAFIVPQIGYNKEIYWIGSDVNLTGSSLAQRTPEGRLRATDPVDQYDLVNLQYLNANALTADNVKTLFGNQSIVGVGNIDLYLHNICFTSTDQNKLVKIRFIVPSSNNLKVDSLTDLKTLLGNTFTYPVNGANSTNNQSIYEITEIGYKSGTSGYVLYDTVTAYPAGTWTDDVKTI